MDGVRLYLLGRQLVKIADASFERAGAESPPRALTLVLEDIVTNPGSAISEITSRTGFPQSHVSTSVARLRDRGIVETFADPDDGRRTLVRASPSYVRAARRRSTSAADQAIAAALDGANAATVRKVVAALELLADHLVPDAKTEVS